MYVLIYPHMGKTLTREYTMHPSHAEPMQRRIEALKATKTPYTLAYFATDGTVECDEARHYPTTTNPNTNE